VSLLALPDLAAALSGAAVGLVLGLIGAGGSIMALPLIYFAVGVPSQHVAVGTSAVAVAASALMSLAGHARAKTVRWGCALVFAASGVVGALAGSIVGKLVPGKILLGGFGILMIVVGIAMLLSTRASSRADLQLTKDTTKQLLPRLIALGVLVGFLAGFFGIGGGFLVVPGLISATAMPILNAIGSSLVSVTAFGAASAASYAYSGLVDWRVAGFFIAGGALGSLLGLAASVYFGKNERLLKSIFAGLVILVGAYVALDQARAGL
jgi:uncharacterized membrane protein YfcA